MVAAAQLCFTSAESWAWLRSLVMTLSEDIDANVIHKRASVNYDPLKHGDFVDNRGKRPHVDEHCRASQIQADMRKRKVGSVKRVNCDDGGSGSAKQWSWWRFCGDDHGVYILKEYGARIGQPTCQRFLKCHRTEKLLHVAWALEESKHAPDARVEKLATS